MLKPQHGGQIYQFAREQSADSNLENILDFSASINPIRPEINWPLVNAQSIKALIHYPDSEQVALKEALATKFNLTCEQITLTNGISSAIMSLFSAFKPDKTLLLTPIYSEYIRASHLYSEHTLEHQINNIENLNSAEFLQTLESLTSNSIVVLVNPSTPIGLFLTPDVLSQFLERIKQVNCRLWIDESFLPFINLKSKSSMRQYLEGNPKLLILQSLTKYYACPGLRIGALFSNSNALDNLPWPSWPVSVLDEQVLLQSLADKEHDAKTMAFFETETPRFIALLNSSELIQYVYPPTVNFALVQTHIKADKLVEALKGFNILVRDCESFGLGQYTCRIAIRSKSENDQLIEKLQLCANLFKIKKVVKSNSIEEPA